MLIFWSFEHGETRILILKKIAIIPSTYFSFVLDPCNYVESMIFLFEV